MQELKVENFSFDQNELQRVMGYEIPNEKLSDRISFGSCKPKKIFFNSIPVLKWLPKYKWKRDFLNDLIAGFTVTVMQIPQGMAYALLGNVPPIVGIYMAFFPVIIYFLLGTSRHNSMGTFAVVCLMVGKIVSRNQEQTHLSENPSTNSTEIIQLERCCNPIEIAVAISFVTGIFQLMMYLLRFGIFANLLSEPLVNGFTTGCAVHVLMSQIKDLFDLKLLHHQGNFEIIYVIINIFQEIKNFNYIATTISGVVIIICVLNEFVKPYISRVSKFPIPVELLLIISGTLLSKHLNLQEQHDIKVVGNIPSGLPAPVLPNLKIVGDVFFESIVIAIIAYTIALSMALTFAQKLSYEVDANQELLAQGASNIFGSFFSCMPISASLSRTLIQESTGGKTQLASLISCFIILFVLLWIGPFFEPLPKSVLASIIIVSLKGMFLQVRALKKFWVLNKIDGVIWISTFLSVVILNVDKGLLVGFSMSLLSLLLMSLKPYTCLLGPVPDTDLYVDISRYRKVYFNDSFDIIDAKCSCPRGIKCHHTAALLLFGHYNISITDQGCKWHAPKSKPIDSVKEISNVKIFHYCGSVNFATRHYFKSELYKLVEINPQKEAARRRKVLKKRNLEGIDNPNFKSSIFNIETISEVVFNSNVRYIVLDFSSVSYIDPSAISTIVDILEEFRKIEIPVYICGCSSPVLEMIEKCEETKIDEIWRIFPTVHDAIQNILSHQDMTSL